MNYSVSRKGGNAFLSSPVRIEIDPAASWAVERGSKYSNREWLFLDGESASLNELTTADVASWPALPLELYDFLRSVLASREMLDLSEDWDGEGSGPYTLEHWRRMVLFLTLGADWVWKRFGRVLPTPTVMAGPGDSIDVQWKTKKGRLLLNFPCKTEVPITYYGEDKKGNTTKSKIYTGNDNSLFVWLMDRM